MSDDLDVRLRRVGAGVLDSSSDAGMVDRVAAHVLGGEPPERVTAIGRFRIERALGHGGMGRVFEVWDPTLQRRVALKLLRGEVGSSTRRRRVLEDEARALARLTDRHVVQVYEIGEHDGALFVVMELVDGTALDRWQAEPRPLAAILDAYVQAGRGLAAAHRVGLVHRDFKPANVLRRADGEVRVADFGLALALDAEGVGGSERGQTEPDPDERRATATTRSRSGTRWYMAPEQLAFGTVDARSDQFSFCVALHEAVTGVRPFTERELLALAADDDERPKPATGTRRSPRWLARILARGLAPRPADRFESMDALVHALVRTPRRRRSIAWGGVLVAVFSAAWWVISPRADPPSCEVPQSLAEVWNPDVQARLRAGARDGPAFASASLHDVERGIAAWADRWRDSYTEACRATWVEGTRTPGQLERAVTCLERGRVGLAKSVELLERPSAETLARASSAVAALPEPTRCLDIDALAEAASPSDRERTLWSTVDTTRLLLALGRPVDGLAEIEQAHLDGSEPERVAATVWLARGEALAALVRVDAAEEALLEAAGLATAAGDLRTAAAAWRDLLALYAHDALDLERATMAQRMVARLRAKLELDPGQEAAIAEAEAMLAELRGDFEQAQRHARGAVELLEAAEGVDPLRLAALRRRLATALQLAGRHDEARTIHADARAELEQVLGAEHPEIGAFEHALGALELDLGQLEKARAHFESALAIDRAALGPDSVRTAASLAVLGHVALLRGDFSTAARLAGEGWALEQTLPLGHADRGTSLAVLAVADERLGHYARALEEHETLLRELGPRASPEQLDIWRINTGWLRCQVSRCLEAREPYERVAVAHRPGELVFHYAQSGLAQVELAEGRPLQARERVQRELADPKVVALGDAELMAELQWTLARALEQLGGSDAEVAKPAATALAVYEGLPHRAAIATELRELLARHGG